jgi:hypothetical protein
MPKMPDPNSRVLKATSPDVYNAIRDNASLDYQTRVPVATRDNITSAVGPAILEWASSQNEFLSALVNRIGLVLFNSKSYTNPFKMFKRGMMALGESVEEIYVNIAKAVGYSPALAETEVFKRAIPDVSAVFHKMDYQNMFKATVSQADLQLAFLTVDGITGLVSKIVESLYTGAELDEFLNMKNLFYVYGQMGQFYPVAVHDLATASADDLKNMVSLFKEYSNTLEFMSTLYNPMGVMTHTPKSEQVLFINAKLDAKIDVNVLAAAFNIDKAEFMGKRVLVDNFGGLTNVYAILADASFFMVFDVLQQMSEIYNPQGLYWNYFLHLWKIFSVSPFANCIMFVGGVPSITSVTTTPATATLLAGASMLLTVDVVSVNYAPKAVVWTLKSIAPLAAGTHITEGGELTLDAEEANDTVTAVATSVYDAAKTDSTVITVG